MNATTGEVAGRAPARFDNPPTVKHRVLRTFDPPVTLLVRGQQVVTLKAAAADVSETVTETELNIGGREYLAYVLLNPLNGVAGLAADLNLLCVVEGVETIAQRSALRAGVQLKGWLTGRPALELNVSMLVSARVSP